MSRSLHTSAVTHMNTLMHTQSITEMQLKDVKGLETWLNGEEILLLTEDSGLVPQTLTAYNCP